MDIPISYLGVVLAAVSSMVIGFVWYGRLFGKQWAHMSGVSMDAMKKPKPSTHVIMVASSLLMAYVLAHVLFFANYFTNTSGVAEGIQGGIWVWLGFVAPVTVGAVLWEGKPWKLWCINAGFYLISLSVMGAILSIW